MKYTCNDIDFMRRCAKRELNKREFFYPQWVSSGRMKQEKADFELEGMRKIVEYLNWQQIHTAPEQQKLF